MTGIDERVRRLEREAESGDQEASSELRKERLRNGLGWSNEPLPSGMSVSMEPPVYKWRAMNGFETEMVRVPAGDGLDDFWIGRFPVTLREWMIFAESAASSGDGPTGMPPELTRLRQRSREWPTPRHSGGRWPRLLPVEVDLAAPATRMNHGLASDFCRWAGGRLPSYEQWLRAAFGGDEHGPRCGCSRGDRSRLATRILLATCDVCLGSGRSERPRPWGKEPPTNDRCIVAKDGSDAIFRGLYPTVRPRCPCCPKAKETRGMTRVALDGGRVGPPFCGSCGTHPAQGYVENEPARPLGASPWGAHDMFGLVREWLLDRDHANDGPGNPYVCCGSVKYPLERGIDLGRASQIGGEDDLGLRLAVGRR